MSQSVSVSLDESDDSFLNGWAFDTVDPTRRVNIEFRLSTGEVTEVCADALRDDLVKQGVGDGRHAFKLKLPPAAFSGPVRVAARVAGSGEPLYGLSKRINPPAMELLAGDIVDNCNLRCPFCLVDYSNLRGLRQMTMETYEKMLTIMPIVKDGMAWLSCLHEPTLNTRLVEMISVTPEPLRQKLSFTTNLCKKLDDQVLRTIAESGIHHFRISYDTANPELFGKLRKGGVYANFAENLSRLKGFLNDAGNRTKIAFVTMALKDNLHEIPEFVRTCADAFEPVYHEVRCMYYGPHLANWGREHMLLNSEWEDLALQLKALPSPVSVALNGPIVNSIDQFATGEGTENYQAPSVSIGNSYEDTYPDIPDPFTIGSARPNSPLSLRLRWDGLVVMDEKPLVNLHQLVDPVSFFQTLRCNCRPDDLDVWRKE